MKKTLLSLIGEQYSGELRSGLVLAVKKALRKKIVDLSREEIALLMRQGIGLEFIVPISIRFLEENTINAREMYMGELLEAVVAIPKEFWINHEELNNRMAEIKDDLNYFFNRLESIKEKLNEFEEIW